MKRVLVTGGAGYIGSHTCKALASAGYQPIVFDNLSAGHEALVRWGPLVRGDTCNRDDLLGAIDAWHPDAVIHFAARIAVGESVQAPWLHHRDNVVGALTLLEAMRARGIARLVFSSSAAVYGLPEVSPVAEGARKDPINPYGRSKLFVESALQDYAVAANLGSIALRYFNAAGADPDGETGELHDPETHLVPLALRALDAGNPPLTVFGNDYATADGTCIRDYVHVSDLARAHVLALEALDGSAGARAFNVGTGHGYSVRQVLDAIASITGQAVPHSSGARRPGDPAHLVSDAREIREALRWQPQLSDLDSIIRTAWQWHRRTQAGAAHG